jgi:hypothetical protein
MIEERERERAIQRQRIIKERKKVRERESRNLKTLKERTSTSLHQLKIKYLLLDQTVLFHKFHYFFIL